MFDTSTLDKAVRERRQRLAAEQAEMLSRVRRLPCWNCGNRSESRPRT